MDVPTQAQLVAIKLTFAEQVRQLEVALMGKFCSIARKNRLLNPHKIFQDVRSPPCAPVVLLDNSALVKIVEVDPTDMSLTLERPLQSLDCNAPVYTSTACTNVLMADTDKIWVEDVADFQAGDLLHQPQFIGSLEDLFAAFSSEWQKRWDRHLYVPIDKWDPLVEFLTDHVAKGAPMALPKITPEAWYQALRHKKKRSARGPDSWAREDLMRMPRDLTIALLEILEQVEQGAPWPLSMITGIISSLEKVPGAGKVSQYRPITVFSIIYRTWSSLRSKAALVHLSQFAPNKCYGNVPGKCAIDLWLAIQAEIEASRSTSAPMTGVMVDIIKCSNGLPRLPIFQVCAHLGVAAPMLQAWSSALHQMERRFSIRGSVSPPCRSTTGCAEGDSLSVMGMLSINILIDHWLVFKIPQAHLWTYVDNMEITASDPRVTLQGLHALQNIIGALDLQLDNEKTFVWGTTPEVRKILSESPYPIAMWARDLGGHIQYSAVPTNSVIVNRIHKFKDRWKQFARSPAPLKQKIHAVASVAWPNVLHGVSSVHLSPAYMDELRTGAMRGLQEHGVGVSPSIHLSLILPIKCDPGFYATWKTICDSRMFLPKDESHALFSHITSNINTVRPKVGPRSVLLNRLHDLLWHWDGNTLRDELGDPVCLWDTCIQELRAKVTRAWQFRILTMNKNRKTFAGFCHTSPQLTTMALPNMPSDLGILKKCLNGSFFTADHQEHMVQNGDTTCPFCDQVDSQRHRHWECPKLESARSFCSPKMKSEILSMDPVTWNHGWIPRPSGLHAWQSHICNLRDETSVFDEAIVPTDTCDIFTDGSSKMPAHKLLRWAAWGVAGSMSMDGPFLPLANGLVPGLVQTISRAELYAAKAALLFIHSRRSHFRIWIDNYHVYHVLHAAAHASTEAELSQSNRILNHDLVHEVQLLMFQVKHLCRAVVKVCSHQDPRGSADPVELWAWEGNNAADRCAEQAFLAYPHTHQQWLRLKEETRHLEELRDVLHKVLIETGRLAMQVVEKHKPAPADILEHGFAPPMQVEQTPWTLPLDLPEAAKYLWIPEWPRVCHWIQDLHTAGLPVRRWCWQQLFIDICLHVGSVGPWYNKNSHGWQGHDTCPKHSFTKRVRSFLTWLNKIAAACQAPLPLMLQRPESHAINFWQPCLFVRISTVRSQAVDEWMMRWKGTFRRYRDYHAIEEIP